jgi:hypothetical protein
MQLWSQRPLHMQGDAGHGGEQEKNDQKKCRAEE